MLFQQFRILVLKLFSEWCEKEPFVSETLLNWLVADLNLRIPYWSIIASHVRWHPWSLKHIPFINPLRPEQNVGKEIFNFFKVANRVNSIYLGQYHGCWCPGSLRRQDISNHDIDWVKLVSPGLIRGRISIIYGMSVWRNDIKCKYMFMFPLKNLARKVLTKFYDALWHH